MTDSRESDLAAYVTSARWFGGKGRDASVVGVRRLARLGDGTDPVVVSDVVEIEYADTAGPSRELYHLPLALYAEPQDRLEHALLGQWEDPDGPGSDAVQVYDAVHDREAMAVWLESFGAEQGDLDFHLTGEHDLDLTAHSTLFPGEQSNSSVMFGEDALLKVFRKLTAGRNPDISIHEVLTEAGSEHVAHLYGYVRAQLGDDEVDLAMLQQFLRTATDGWDLALTSVRNLYAEGDLHADEVGGDFAGEARRLGTALREVHQTLAENFPTHARTTDDLARLAASMNARLDEALQIAPALAEHEQALRRAYDDVAHHPGDTAQTVHGDLHLGQTLRTVKGWKIVDFEGEPAKPLSERVLPDSPWRDVAGMLRSFDYAPHVVAMTAAHGGADGGDGGASEQRRYRAEEWSARNRAAFLDAYADGRELTDAEHALLAAYVADKATYEAVYETRNRPDWVGIPLAAIARELDPHGGAA